MSADPFAPVPVIEAHLDQTSQCPQAPRALREAVRYALLQGGKRLRPVLAWQACVACGSRGEGSLDAGAAVELVHAFSLVHDDLPAIDNDDLRRGRPTLHRHAGEAMAILAGDAMLASAFDLLARCAGEPGVPWDSGPTPLERAASPLLTGVRETHGRDLSGVSLPLRLIQELSRATGSMIHGQVWDTLGGLPAGLGPGDAIRLIHRNKTGALIVAACRMGALCALGDVDEAHPVLTAVDAYGSAIGLMYQIVDDLIDVEQPAEVAGKRTGKDAQAGKLTYPGVLGVGGARSEISRLERDALAALSNLGPAARSLGELATYLAGRTK